MQPSGTQAAAPGCVVAKPSGQGRHAVLALLGLVLIGHVPQSPVSVAGWLVTLPSGQLGQVSPCWGSKPVSEAVPGARSGDLLHERLVDFEEIGLDGRAKQPAHQRCPATHAGCAHVHARRASRRLHDRDVRRARLLPQRVLSSHMGL